MKCPHCLVEINANYSEFPIGKDKDGNWSIYTMNCPSPQCLKLIVELAVGSPRPNSTSNHLVASLIKNRHTVRPAVTGRTPISPEVDNLFAQDYNEACLTLTLSPKASAALSRRCLQNILREKAKVKHGDLANEIQQVIDSNNLPSHLSESIDAVRHIGNFGTHPIKSTSTGEIVDVEFGEAEWLLDVLESLFDFYFVQPAILKGKRDALNKKLEALGKAPMK